MFSTHSRQEGRKIQRQLVSSLTQEKQTICWSSEFGLDWQSEANLKARNTIFDTKLRFALLVLLRCGNLSQIEMNNKLVIFAAGFTSRKNFSLKLK